MTTPTVNESKAQRLLASAIRALMDQRKLSEAAVSELTALRGAGVSQRHINSILREQTNCTISMAMELANAFDMPVWQLLVPGRTNYPKVSSARLEKVVAAYLRADENLRAVLDKLAEQA